MNTWTKLLIGALGIGAVVAIASGGGGGGGYTTEEKQIDAVGAFLGS